MDLTMMYGGDGWMWHQGGWGFGGWVLMTLAMIVFWAVVITAVVLVIRQLAGGGSHRNLSGAGAARTAEDVLAERYARGEIDDDEFRKRVALLREHR
jgi:putative membrane protein